MSEPRNWKVLEDVKNPICPLISAHTVKQANKYIECVKENCMWWSKCKTSEEQSHGQWIKGVPWSTGVGMGEQYGYYYTCSECGHKVKGGYKSCGIKFCQECGSDNRKIGEE